MERVVDRAHRRALRFLAERRRWRVLALGESVDAVVEQDDVEVEIAANGVHQVIAADRETVADARDEHDLLAGNAERRHHLFHLRENGIVAAARTPTHILIAGEISWF